MLDGLRGGDAPGWQIDQIIAWDDKVRWAVTCADLAGAGDGTLDVFTGESSGLPAWHLCCLSFLRSLQRQEREADLLRAGETRAAAEDENSARAALAAGNAASAARHRKDAEGHRGLARKYADWLSAAREARACGARMLTGALPRHRDAAAGLAAAGGKDEVYRDARWAVREEGGRAAV
jgi:hypothetical protein